MCRDVPEVEERGEPAGAVLVRMISILSVPFQVRFDKALEVGFSVPPASPYADRPNRVIDREVCEITRQQR